jgi:broad specificity phosphatase PhoE
MAKLVLVRHGESRGNVWSEANRDDRTNFLSAKGRKQAEIAGMDLSDDEFDFSAVISSSMTRALETTVTIMSAFNADDHIRDYIIKDGLRECRSRSVAFEHQLGVNECMHQVIMPELEKGDVLCVTHYHTMQAIFTWMEQACPPFQRKNIWCEGKCIPNAMPFVYDQETPNKWIIYNHYFERTQYL